MGVVCQEAWYTVYSIPGIGAGGGSLLSRFWRGMFASETHRWRGVRSSLLRSTSLKNERNWERARDWKEESEWKRDAERKKRRSLEMWRGEGQWVSNHLEDYPAVSRWPTPSPPSIKLFSLPLTQSRRSHHFSCPSQSDTVMPCGGGKRKTASRIKR